MKDYLDSIKKRDPAAKSLLSIVLTYPGVKAVFFHQISNFLKKQEDTFTDFGKYPLFFGYINRNFSFYYLFSRLYLSNDL